jgi:hypothetical protein
MERQYRDFENQKPQKTDPTFVSKETRDDFNQIGFTSNCRMDFNE